MTTGLHCLMVGGIDCWHGAIVNCSRPGIAGRVTEAWSHDEDKCQRRVIGVHGSVTWVQNKSVTGDMEMQHVGTEM